MFEVKYQVQRYCVHS